MNTETDDRFLPILEQSAKILGIDCPQLDTLGTCDIAYKDEFQLSVIAPPFTGFVHLAAPVCLLDLPGSEKMYRRALEANFMLSETRGATLAIDANRNQLLLCIRFPLETLTAERFADALVALGTVAEKLREELPVERDAGDPPEDGGSYESPEIDMIRV